MGKFGGRETGAKPFVLLISHRHTSKSIDISPLFVMPCNDRLFLFGKTVLFFSFVFYFRWDGECRTLTKWKIVHRFVPRARASFISYSCGECSILAIRRRSLVLGCVSNAIGKIEFMVLLNKKRETMAWSGRSVHLVSQIITLISLIALYSGFIWVDKNTSYAISAYLLTMVPIVFRIVLGIFRRLL